MKLARRTLCSFVTLVTLLAMPSFVGAQGVTTGSLTGVVTDQAGAPVASASVIAIHLPSGSAYETVTRSDGRFAIPGMRVGGPYSVTIAYGGSGGAAFSPVTQEDVVVNLGVTSDLVFSTQAISVQETVTVSGVADPVFSSTRTGAATSVSREEIALIPTVSGRLSDVTRLTPQSSNSGFAGNDNRMNNITVDGSSFNNSFGLGGQPGDRTGVAAISLEALEQIQVNVAPFDVRQGSFIGAGVNSVTRSGTNRFVGSAYHRFRDQDWVGTDAKGQTVNPGTFTFRNTGGYLAGPIVKNKLFAFTNYEDQQDKRPLTTFRANRGEAVGGQITRVLASDLAALSSFLSNRFSYDTGAFEDIDDLTPVKRFLVRSDYNLNNSNKIALRYTHLNSFTDVGMSNSASALGGRNSGSTQFLGFANSNYQILENIRSGIGEWNMVIGGSMSNQLQTGYTYQDESRDTAGSKLFPFVDIFEAGVNYTSFGFEPFSVNNELRYKTFQIQDNFTKFTAKHSITAGGYLEKYRSENVFFGCCPQSAYSYNSLADFYTDANDALANPNRTVSPVQLRAFQVRWANIPGQETPEQPLDVWYGAGYLQDEWRPRTNLTVTAGVRFDVSKFGDTAYPNPAADALTFRSESGSPIQYSTGEMPSTKVLWSPRVGVNWDVFGNQSTQLRGGGGLFSGRPAYVWISNQIGNTGVLIGERIVLSPGNSFPFTDNVDRYKQPATGAGASSYALNVTDPDFKFPQVWRGNIAIDRRLPFGIVSTTEFLAAKDVNGVYYFNANLPGAQSAYTGVDSRPRWVGTACAATGQAGGCVNRINNDTGNQVTQALVLKNGNSGRSWNLAQTLSLNTRFGLTVRTAYSYGESRSISDPESTAATSFARNSTSVDPNNPGTTLSMWSPGHRVFALVNYSRRYFGFGATAISLFWEAQHSTVTGSSRFSYTFGADMNGDGVATNDLIYIPRNTAEMNFAPFTVGTRTFTAAEQADAFESYIQQDKYLRKNRGRYATRNGGVMPLFQRADLSITQDVFKDIRGQRNALQVRADILNVGNLLNSDWGVSERPVASINNNNQLQILTNPAVDASGASTYRLALFSNELIRRTFQTSAGTGDVWTFMLSLRYSFN